MSPDGADEGLFVDLKPILREMMQGPIRVSHRTPYEAEAMLWPDGDAPEGESASAVIEWITHGGGSARLDGSTIRIQSPIGDEEHVAVPGEWVVCVEGEHYPMPPESFNRTWRPARGVMEQDFSSKQDASELVRLGECSPQCLLATGEDECECVCGGDTHGALATTMVDLSRLHNPPDTFWMCRRCGEDTQRKGWVIRGVPNMACDSCMDGKGQHWLVAPECGVEYHDKWDHSDRFVRTRSRAQAKAAWRSPWFQDWRAAVLWRVDSRPRRARLTWGDGSLYGDPALDTSPTP